MLALILILRKSAEKEELKSKCETQKLNIRGLREKQKQLQATIDDLTKTLEPDVSTCEVGVVTTSK